MATAYRLNPERFIGDKSPSEAAAAVFLAALLGFSLSAAHALTAALLWVALLAAASDQDLN